MSGAKRDLMDADDNDTDERSAKRRKIPGIQNPLELRAGVKLSTTKISVTSKCTLSKLLNPRYKRLKNIFRVIAEIYSVTRRDAMNFGLLMVCRWVESGFLDSKWPEIATEKFWNHCYRAVMPDYNGLINPKKIKYDNVIIDSIGEFNSCRIDATNNTFHYLIPPYDQLQGYIAKTYATDVVTNVKLHLRSPIKIHIRKVIKGFLIGYHHHYSTTSFQFGKKASILFESIVNYTPLPSGTISEIPGPNEHVQSFYEALYTQYHGLFAGASFDDLIDFEKVHLYSKQLLAFSSFLLKYIQENNLIVKTWSLLPVASHQIAHVKLSGAHIMYHVLATAFKYNFPVPSSLMQTYDNVNYTFIGYNDFEKMYSDKLTKELIWEELFDLDSLRKKRFRHSLGNHSARYELDYGIQTDGYMVSILFKKTVYERIPGSSEELKKFRKKVNVEDWKRGLIKLNKEPLGLRYTDRIIGIDPGYRDLIHAVSTNEGMDNKIIRKASSFAVSNGEYQQRAGVFWHRQQELKSRKKADIQKVYDGIPSPNTVTVSGISNYIHYISLNHQIIFGFNKSFKHRELKGYMYSNKKMAMNYITDVVIGKANCNEPIQLAHKYNKETRRRKRQELRGRRTTVPDGVRTVVAFGDFSGSGLKKGHASVPTKQFQRVLASKSLVILVDEFRTSITCNKCHGALESVYKYSEHDCKHNKIKLKKPAKLKPNGQKKVRLKALNCLNDQNQIVCQYKDCRDRISKECKKLIYPLKQCKMCSVDGKPMHYNRDLNAALNIRSILIDYINSGCDIESRNPALKRAQNVQDA